MSLADYDEQLLQRLRDPKEATAYLLEFLHDDGKGDHWLLLLQAVHNVAKAHPPRSDLQRVDAMRDDDIDYSDTPQPDLTDWVRGAMGFAGSPQKE